MEDWKKQMVASKANSTKKKIINFLAFLVIWLVIYYLIKFNFGVIALILSYMLVYFRTDKEIINGIVFLADEFDKHHNNLANELNEFREMKENDDSYKDIHDLREKIWDLEQQIKELRE